ncbi:MAG TPA: guanine deaminase [Bryobacteraceae bacterium]|nr:guanine deaminase [Bryobacteraceae bacterium]
MSAEIVRSTIFHTPRNPFRETDALEFIEDGALLINDGRIQQCGEYGGIARAHPECPVHDLRGGYVLPGFIDTHVHFPQIRALGGLGHELLDWLECVALPEEARMADPAYAGQTARSFVRALIRSGTTTALVFGAHFSQATAALFRAAAEAGIRIVSGLVLSDRRLRPELHQKADDAYRASNELIAEFHGRDRLLYAVTPRFALSASEAMLEVCQSLLSEHSELRFTTHINENHLEIAEVARLFPWARDYLAVYEKFGLLGPGAVLAHNIHASDGEIERIAVSRTAISHCPWSNALLGSGLFRMRKHVDAGVVCALGSDVGGGAGFGLLKEALQAYAIQRIAPDGMKLSPAQLLYLSTRAGAEALLLEEETGDFTPGKSADFVYIKPRAGSLIHGVLERAQDAESILAAILTLGSPEVIEEVRIAGVAPSGSTGRGEAI